MRNLRYNNFEGIDNDEFNLGLNFDILNPNKAI